MRANGLARRDSALLGVRRQICPNLGGNALAGRQVASVVEMQPICVFSLTLAMETLSAACWGFPLRGSHSRMNGNPEQKISCTCTTEAPLARIASYCFD